MKYIIIVLYRGARIIPLDGTGAPLVVGERAARAHITAWLDNGVPAFAWPVE